MMVIFYCIATKFISVITTHLYPFVIAVGTRGTDSGRLVAMATAQPAFNMATAASVAATTTATTASPSDLVGGVVGGGGGGGGSQQGQQGVSPTATVTVVTSPPTQQQQQQASQQAIVSANSVSITAVTHQTLQQVRGIWYFLPVMQHKLPLSYCLGKRSSVQRMYPYLEH
jgi:hypothetical protein